MSRAAGEKSMKRAFTAATIILVSLLSGCAGSSNKGVDLSCENEAERDEYSIYSLGIEYVYLRNLLSSNKREVESIVILSRTNELDEYWRRKFVGYLANEGIPWEVINDWIRNNESSIQLQRKFDLSYRYYMVTREELDKFKAGTFFEQFYRRWPDSNGVIAVSRIGFDEKRKKALVHLIHSYGVFGAAYFFVELEKIGGEWAIIKSVPTDPAHNR